MSTERQDTTSIVREQTPILESGHTFGSVTDKISSIVLTGKTPRLWWVGFSISFAFFTVWVISVAYLLYNGVGIWGINIPVAWGFAIINFVWWIGIGHAGTLISAVLLLLRQDWRTSINRFAEAMTLFAVVNAGLLPILHLGRLRFFYYMMPYPNTMGLWPQFRSPLVWDVFAITTYATVSALFWYVGLIPDLATLRDRSKSVWGRVIYGMFALGWRNSARHWHRYQKAYFLLAALATPLVISVHSIVGLDFAYSVVPGWHVTLFPPYFVAGAVLSGFAMVMAIAIPLRKAYRLEDFITLRHLDNMAKVMLGMALIVSYGYMMENFFAFYSGDEFEIATTINRWTGVYAPFYVALILLNVVIPQAFWFQRVRRSPIILFTMSILINFGMWFERFIIVVTSLYRDYLPSSWHIYIPTIWDISLFLGSLGLFFTLLFLFLRFVPVISIFEMRELVAETGETAPGKPGAPQEPGQTDPRGSQAPAD